MAVLSPALDPAQPTGLLQGGRFDQRNEDLAVVNPYTGEEIARVAVGGPEDVDAAVAEATTHLPPPSPAERAQVLERAARLVADRAETFARTICLEAGKPMKQARAEAARCVDTLTFAAVEARSLAGEMVPMESSAAGAGKLGIIVREPMGVVGRDLAVQLPPQPGRPQARARDRGRLPGRPEAGLGDAPVGAAAGAHPGRGRAAGRLPLGGDRRRRLGGQRPGQPPRRPDDLLHGQPAGGLGHPPAPAAQARRPGARQLHPGDGGAGRRPRDRRPQARRLGLHPRRPVLHLGAAGLRPRGRLRPLPRALRRRRRGPGGGRPDGRRHRRRPGHRRGEPRPHPGVDRRGALGRARPSPPAARCATTA